MGWKVELFDETDPDSFWVLNQYDDAGNRINQITGYECANIRKDEIMSFKSWDELMPVVEKIEAMGNEIGIRGCRCAIQNLINPHFILENVSLTKLEATYQAVLSFITFYNQKK